MAGHAVANIGDLFLTVLLLHFLLIMAHSTGVDGRIAAGVARAAFPISSLMVDGERVVKRRIAEITRILVTIPTGAAEMIGRGRVAHGAILAANQAMIELRIAEIIGIRVAACTGPCIMIRWGRVAVGAITPAQVGMIEVDRAPVGGNVAKGTRCTIVAIMWVIEGMAVVTDGWRSAVIAGRMAGGAV